MAKYTVVIERDEDGWLVSEVVELSGCHMAYRHPDGRKTVIPHHAGEEIGPGLLNKIIKQDLNITREEFLEKL